jgi:hypothetical protein
MEEEKFEKQGLEKTGAGYVLPGIDPKLIKLAIKNRIEALRSR